MTDTGLLLPEPGPETLVVLTETTLGRVVVREHSPSGLFTLGPEHRFVVTERKERLTMEVRIQAYEEIVVRREGVDRMATVTSVLRREEAEVVVEGPVSGA